MLSLDRASDSLADPRRWGRVQELFAQALPCPPERREDLLERGSAGDAALRAEVEALLAADAEASGFLRAVAGEDPDQEPPEPPERIGPYRITGELGRGGMGAVYLAERADGEFRQRVALKLLRRDLGSGAEVHRRFRKERQILAGFDHPNIARLLDGGTTPDGRPFFVLEAIDGEPIDRHRLSVAERLALFRTVCAAVAGGRRARERPARLSRPGWHDFGFSRGAMGLTNLLYRGFQQVKAGVERIPGAHRAYKWITTRTGEGKVYEITRGPMAGMRWRRRNCLPFWYHLGIYEPETSRFLAAHLRPGDTFWDLGANAGYHTLMGARAVGATGRAIAVEPDPGTCQILREQLELNGIGNCTIVQAAVSDRPGQTVLIRRGSDPRGNALQQIDNPAIDNREGDAVEVPSLTLDELSSLYPAPRLIKMDIEGAEVLALPGGRTFLSSEKRPERLLVAVHGEAARDFCRDFLRDLGYALETAPDLDAHSLLAVDRSSEARRTA